MRNQMRVSETPSKWITFMAPGTLDGHEVNLCGHGGASPRVCLDIGPMTLFLSPEAAQVLGEHLLLAVKALAEEGSHD